MRLRTVFLTLSVLTVHIDTAIWASETDIPPTFTLGFLGPSVHVLHGSKVSIPITYSGPTLRFSSLDLRFVYNERVLLLLKVDWGRMFRNIPTVPVYYQQSSLDSALSDNMNATVHLMALSKIGDTDITVDEMIEVNDGDTLAMLDFQVSGDRTLTCSLLPLRWFWSECGNNTLVTELVTLNSYSVSDLVENEWIDRVYRKELTDPPAELPSISGVPASCVENVSAAPDASRSVVFENGGVWLPCYWVRPRGDVNLNGIDADTGDVNLLAQYITRGESVLTIQAEAQLSQLYINEDSIPGDITDFVYLIKKTFRSESIYPFLEEL
ncbi:MAG: hypothetical protein IH914_11070 [candidate division Zixibacteria bacterium]|nr:hypothetical protein [candidate division Zixibacteria bacterium]